MQIAGEKDVTLWLVPTLSLLGFWKSPFTCWISLKVPLFLLMICWWIFWVPGCLALNVSSSFRTQDSASLHGQGLPSKAGQSWVCCFPWTFLEENKQPVSSVVGVRWLLIQLFPFPTLQSIMCILESRATVDAAPQYHRFKKGRKKNQLDAIIIKVYWLQVCSGWLDKLNEKFLDREILYHTPHVQSFVYTETPILCSVYFKNPLLFLQYNDMPVKPKGALAYSFTHSLLLLPSFPWPIK